MNISSVISDDRHSFGIKKNALFLIRPRGAFQLRLFLKWGGGWHPECAPSTATSWVNAIKSSGLRETLRAFKKRIKIEIPWTGGCSASWCKGGNLLGEVALAPLCA
jgi:hypothetical protein